MHLVGWKNVVEKQLCRQTYLKCVVRCYRSLKKWLRPKTRVYQIYYHIAINRLTGRNQVQLYEYPWMALIVHNIPNWARNFKWLGSIINKRYVLTTAHCVKNWELVGVRVGEYDISTHVDCDGRDCENYKQDIGVEEAVIHKKFQHSPVMTNDIALIRLAEDIEFNHRNVHRICLPTTSELRGQDVSNKVAALAGWQWDPYSTLSVVQKATVPILTTQSCQGLYNSSSTLAAKDLITSKHLCAGGGNMDACTFLSGSPLMLEGSNNNLQRYVQYGILSFGPKQCGLKIPDVYTDVTKYMKWILDNIYP